MSNWSDVDSEDDGGTMGGERRPKVCENCKRYILYRGNLVRVRGDDRKMHTYCVRCAPKGNTDAGQA